MHGGCGYVWDEVLEYRAWCHLERGAPDEDEGSDYNYAFDNVEEALHLAQDTKGAETPLALVLQREWINERQPGVHEQKFAERIAEGQCQWLGRKQVHTESDGKHPVATTGLGHRTGLAQEQSANPAVILSSTTPGGQGDRSFFGVPRMRKIFLIPAILAGTLTLGGCAQYGGGLLGTGYGNDRYDDRYGSNYGYNRGGDFERAAADACGREASRYGRARVDEVNQEGRDTVIVTGYIDSRKRRGDGRFGCTFRSDGRITDFRRF